MNLTHPNRELYQGITKQDLLKFYEKIKKWILPHLLKRPLTFVRCPSGFQKNCFYQKHLRAEEKNHVISSIKIKEKTAIREYAYLRDFNGIVKLIQLSILEMHPWNVQIDNLEQPDRVIFDLDPGKDVKWVEVIKAAKLIHQRLKEKGLKSFVKTTGSKGLHVVIPIIPQYNWNAVKNFAKNFATELAKDNPEDFTASPRKSERHGKIFIDYLRNNKGATSVCAYGVRAAKNAPISTPLSWDELTTKIKPNFYTIKNLPKRLERLKSDPWKGFFSVRQYLPLS